MWDFKAFRPELGRIGFRNVRQAKSGDSFDIRFHEVEEAGRWENCLGVECEK